MRLSSLRPWFLGLTLLCAGAGRAHAADAAKIRAEVGKPLQEAQAAIQAKSYRVALDKIGEAEKVGDLKPYEAYLVDRLRANAALGAGDHATALQALSAAVVSPEMPEAEKPVVLDTVARLAYEGKQYPQAAQAIRAYRTAGGTSTEVLGLLPQALYLADDFAQAQKELLALFEQQQRAGQGPSEMQLKLYLSCAVKQNDRVAYRDALERLLGTYPQPDYWRELIAQTTGQPGFSDRLTLDVYRLKKATGTLNSASGYAEAAQLALQAGFPGEARQYLDQGYARSLLGQGADAARDRQLKAQVDKKLEEDLRTLAEGEKAAAAQASGEALVATGLNYAGHGRYDKAASLIAQGIARGGLKRPDEAQLHLGYAQLLAGQAEPARKTLASVTGADGTAALARLWLLVKQPV